MIIRAKLKGDKAMREISFTGHGETDPKKVEEVFKRIHPEGEFGGIVKPGLDRATGIIRDHSKDEQSIAPAHAIVPAHEVNPGAVAPPVVETTIPGTEEVRS